MVRNFDDNILKVIMNWLYYSILRSVFVQSSAWDVSLSSDSSGVTRLERQRDMLMPLSEPNRRSKTLDRAMKKNKAPEQNQTTGFKVQMMETMTKQNSPNRTKPC
jgi:hypothetical protein